MFRENLTRRPHQDNSMHRAAGLQGKKAEKSKRSCIEEHRGRGVQASSEEKRVVPLFTGAYFPGWLPLD